MSLDKQESIRRALWALGIINRRVAALDLGGRAVVNVDGRRFGIWDFGRACFVD